MLQAQHPGRRGRSGFRLGSSFVRCSAGAIGTLAALAAGYLLFVPFADLSSAELAAGACPGRAGATARTALIGSATGRQWGARTAECALLAAAKRPVVRVAGADAGP